MRETLATKTAARDQHDFTLAEAATKIEWRKTQQSKIQQQLAELSARINRNDVYEAEVLRLLEQSSMRKNVANFSYCFKKACLK